MKRRFTPLQIIVHVGAWIPLILLIFDFFTGRLSVNPIQNMEQRTGRAAITLLVLSLTCTPLNTIFGWREALKRRRALGLYAFMYASLHMLVFVGLDYTLSWPLIRDAILEKRYILVGAVSFLLLLPLAITSFKYWMRRLGKNWTRLHRLIYLIAPLVVLHYAWAKKGDLFHLRGDILWPFVYGLIVILLLLFRLPLARKAMGSVRTRVQVLVQKGISIFRKQPTSRLSRPSVEIGRREASTLQGFCRVAPFNRVFPVGMFLALTALQARFQFFQRPTIALFKTLEDGFQNGFAIYGLIQ